MIETKFALHIHTNYSDGNASHQELVDIARQAGLDGIITTDHNIWISGIEKYYGEGKKKILLMVGEEVHDRALDPPGNHMLVIGAQKELLPHSREPQRLIEQIDRSGGLSFIAHPIEDPLEMFNEKDFSWRNWEVEHFTGIELWNQMSEFKSVTNDLFSATVNALFPKRMTLGPLDRTLKLWDDLIAIRNRPIVAIGGVDAHRLIKKVGPIKIKLYSYLHHFRSITTHLLLSSSFTGKFTEDRNMVIDALRKGHCFVAYDLPSATDGFRFSAHNDDGNFIMGDQVRITGGLTLQVRLPHRAQCRLIKNGVMIKDWSDRDVCTHTGLKF